MRILTILATFIAMLCTVSNLSAQSRVEVGNSLNVWVIDCSIDAMTDERICYMTSRIDIFVYHTSKLGVFVVVGKNHYPGKPASIRVDKNTAIVGNEGIFSSANSSIILQQLKRGVFVYIRYWEWPNPAHIDDDATLFGFTEAFKVMESEYRKLKL